jgi:hypothetical protein
MCYHVHDHDVPKVFYPLVHVRNTLVVQIESNPTHTSLHPLLRYKTHCLKQNTYVRRHLNLY